MPNALETHNETPSSAPRTKINVVAGGSINVFGTDINVNFQINGDKAVFRVYNDNIGNSPTSIKVSDISNQINKMIKDLTGNESAIEINISWPQEVQEVIDNTSVSLNVIYLKFTKSMVKNSVVEDDSLEYALWINVQADEQTLDKFPIAITNLYLKLWSDNVDPAIVGKMDLNTTNLLEDNAKAISNK